MNTNPRRRFMAALILVVAIGNTGLFVNALASTGKPGSWFLLCMSIVIYALLTELTFRVRNTKPDNPE